MINFDSFVQMHLTYSETNVIKQIKNMQIIIYVEIYFKVGQIFV